MNKDRANMDWGSMDEGIDLVKSFPVYLELVECFFNIDVELLALVFRKDHSAQTHLSHVVDFVILIGTQDAHGG